MVEKEENNDFMDNNMIMMDNQTLTLKQIMDNQSLLESFI